MRVAVVSHTTPTQMPAAARAAASAFERALVVSVDRYRITNSTPAALRAAGVGWLHA